MSSMNFRKKNNMTKAEKFAKLNGIHWHEELPYDRDNKYRYQCSCGGGDYNQENFNEYYRGTNPLFLDAKSILEVMNKRKDYKKFQHNNKNEIFVLYNEVWSDSCFSLISFEAAINEYYIIHPEKLLDAAIKFCEENPPVTSTEVWTNIPFIGCECKEKKK